MPCIEPSVGNLRREQRAEARFRTASKPLVHGKDRPVVLLNLLFAQSQIGDERDVKTPLNHFPGSVGESSGACNFNRQREELGSLTGRTSRTSRTDRIDRKRTRLNSSHIPLS